MKLLFLVNHGWACLLAVAGAGRRGQPQFWKHFGMSIRIVVEFLKGLAIGAHDPIESLQNLAAGIPKITPPSHSISLAQTGPQRFTQKVA